MSQGIGALSQQWSLDMSEIYRCLVSRVPAAAGAGSPPRKRV